jgi:hypothetical protein
MKATYPDVWRLNRSGYCSRMHGAARPTDALSGDVVSTDEEVGR